MKNHDFKIQFDAYMFQGGEEDRARSERAVVRQLRALFWTNVDWLEGHPDTPRLYDSGVVYKLDPPGVEDFAAIPVVLARGFGDCKKLACWLAAEVFVRHVHDGIRAYPILLKGVESADGKRITYHIVVKVAIPEKTADGRWGWIVVIEDPSARLGMLDNANAPEWAHYNGKV